MNFNNDISYGYPFTDISGDWEITKTDETPGTVDISNIERMIDNSNNLYKLIISLSGETLTDINDGKIYDISFSTDSSNIKMLNNLDTKQETINIKTTNNYSKFKEAYEYYYVKSYDISLASSSTNNFFSSSFNKTILDVSNNVYANTDFKYKANERFSLWFGMETVPAARSQLISLNEESRMKVNEDKFIKGFHLKIDQVLTKLI